MIVLDHISRGRAIFTLGIGYRPDEYELHGVEYRRRGAIADEKLEILLQHLRAASSGDAAVRVTPAPFTAGGPMVTWGGTTPKAAQRAARFGLGFLSQSFDATLAPAYEQACKDAGTEPFFCYLPPADSPNSVFVHDALGPCVPRHHAMPRVGSRRPPSPPAGRWVPGAAPLRRPLSAPPGSGSASCPRASTPRSRRPTSRPARTPARSRSSAISRLPTPPTRWSSTTTSSRAGATWDQRCSPTRCRTTRGTRRPGSRRRRCRSTAPSRSRSCAPPTARTGSSPPTRPSA